MLFKESELVLPAGVPTGMANPTLSNTMTVAQALTAAGTVNVPNIALSSVSAADQGKDCQVIEMDIATFQALAPSYTDMAFLAHGRQVPLEHKTIENDGCYAIVAGNRLAATGTDDTTNYVAHLVSMEGMDAYMPGQSVTAGNTLRMISLASWSFTTTPELGLSFRDAMYALVSARGTSSSNLFLQLPDIQAYPEAPHVHLDIDTLVQGTNSFGSLGNASDLDFANNSPFTFEVWVKATAADLTGSKMLLAKFAGSTDSGSQYFVALQDGVPTGYRYIEQPKGQTAYLPLGMLQADKPLEADRWYHVAITYDGAVLSLYVNGEFKTGVANGASAPSSTYNTLIGAAEQASAQTDYFGGSITGLRIWTEVRTGEQLAANMGAVLNAANFPNLLAYTIGSTSITGNASVSKQLLNFEPSAQQVASSTLRKAYVPVSFHTRSGEQTFSWYRGPLIPFPRQDAPNRELFPSATAAYIYDPNTGVFDLSNGVAWETGRMMALADNNFSVTLLNWRRHAQRKIELLKSRLGNTKVAAELKNVQDVAALQKLVSNRLLSNTFFTEFTDQLIAMANGTGLAQGTIIQSTPYQQSTEMVDLLKEPAVQQLLTLDATWQQQFESICEWLGKLSLLYGVPFENLVPNNAMLPIDSIRFFYLDQDYLDSMVDGALSVGTQSSKDSLYNQVMRKTISEGVKQAMHKLRDQLLGLTPTTENTIPHSFMSGCLIRSSVVHNWPGMEVVATTLQTTGGSTNEVPLKKLRLERLAPDVLLCIFAGVPDQVAIHEPAESFHFGLNDVSSASGTQQGLYLRNIVAPVGALTNTGSGYQLPANAFRSGSNNVLDVGALALDIQPQLNLSGTPTADFASAAFALQMIDVPQRMDLYVSATKPVFQEIEMVNGGQYLVQRLTTSHSNNPVFVAYDAAQPNAVPVYQYSMAIDNQLVYVYADDNTSVPGGYSGKQLAFYAFSTQSGVQPPGTVPLYVSEQNITINGQAAIQRFYSITNAQLPGYTQPAVMCYVSEESTVISKPKPVPVSQQVNHWQIQFFGTDLDWERYDYVPGAVDRIAFYADASFDGLQTPIFKYRLSVPGSDNLSFFRLSPYMDPANANGFTLESIAFFAYVSTGGNTPPAGTVAVKEYARSGTGGNVVDCFYSLFNNAPKGYTATGNSFFVPEVLQMVYYAVLSGNKYNVTYLIYSETPPAGFLLDAPAFVAYKDNKEGRVAVNLYTLQSTTNPQLYRYAIDIDANNLNGYSKNGVVFYGYRDQQPGTVPVYEYAQPYAGGTDKMYYYSIFQNLPDGYELVGIAFYVSSASLILTNIPV